MNYFIPEEDAKEIADNLNVLNYRFEGAEVLVLGCFGFLGRLFLSYFFYLNKNVLKEPCHVIGMDSFVIGDMPKEVGDENFDFIKHDICEPLWEHINPKRKISYIINCTGIASPKSYIRLPIKCLQIALQGSINALDVAKEKEVEGILQFGSSEHYGSPRLNEIPSKEEYPSNIYTMGERAPYDQSKSLTECVSDIYFRKYNVKTKLVRPFNVSGPPMGLGDGRVLSSFLASLLVGEKMKVYGTGVETRSVAYCTDFLTGALLVLLNGEAGKVWNVGSDREISIKDLAILVGNITGYPDMIQYIEPEKVYAAQPNRRCPSLTLIKSQLGYSPKVSLEEGISRYWKWIKDNHVPQCL